MSEPYQPDNLPTQSESEVTISSITSVPTKLTGTLSKNQKFRKMLSLSQKLAILASNCGIPDFCQKYSDVENLIRSWENNVPFVVTPTSDATSHLHEQVFEIILFALILNVTICNAPLIG